MATRRSDGSVTANPAELEQLTDGNQGWGLNTPVLALTNFYESAKVGEKGYIPYNRNRLVPYNSGGVAQFLNNVKITTDIYAVNWDYWRFKKVPVEVPSRVAYERITNYEKYPIPDIKYVGGNRYAANIKFECYIESQLPPTDLFNQNNGLSDFSKTGNQISGVSLGGPNNWGFTPKGWSGYYNSTINKISIRIRKLTGTRTQDGGIQVNDPFESGQFVEVGKIILYRKNSPRFMTAPPEHDLNDTILGRFGSGMQVLRNNVYHDGMLLGGFGLDGIGSQTITINTETGTFTRENVEDYGTWPIEWNPPYFRFDENSYYYLTVEPEKNPIEKIGNYKDTGDLSITDILNESDGYRPIDRVVTLGTRFFRSSGLTTQLALDYKNGPNGFKVYRRGQTGYDVPGSSLMTTTQAAKKLLNTNYYYSDNDNKIPYEEFLTYGVNVLSGTRYPNIDKSKYTKQDIVDEKAEYFAWFKTPSSTLFNADKLTIPASKIDETVLPKVYDSGYDPPTANGKIVDGTNLYNTKIKGKFYYDTLDVYLRNEFVDQEYLNFPTLKAQADLLIGTVKNELLLPAAAGFRYKRTTDTIWKTQIKSIDSKDYQKYVRDLPKTKTLEASKDDNRKIEFDFEITDMKFTETWTYQVWVQTKGGDRYYSKPQKLENDAEIYYIVIDNVRLTDFVGPNTNLEGHWYQIFDSWRFVDDRTVGVFNKTLAVKPNPPTGTTQGDQYKYNKAIGPHYIYYYLNKTFTSDYNYRFRTVTTGYYAGINANNTEYTPDYGFGMLLPWGERLDVKTGFSLPFLSHPLSNNVAPQGTKVSFNLYVNSNINGYIINKYAPEKRIDRFKSTTNPQNPVTFFANHTFQNDITSLKQLGLGFFEILDMEWILQGYGGFSVNAQSSPNSPMTEEIPYKDPISKEWFAGKGWHYIDSEKKIFWFDKVGTNQPGTNQIPYQHELKKNLPIGGNVDDFMSEKKESIDYLINNFAAIYVKYQRFNINFKYNNASDFGVTMYLGSKLPYKKSEGEWYVTDIEQLIELGYVKKLANLAEYLPKGKEHTVDFVGLEGGQYIFFVADPIIRFHDGDGNMLEQNLKLDKEFISNGPLLFSDETSGYGPKYSMISIYDFKLVAAYNKLNNVVVNSNTNWSISNEVIDTVRYKFRLGSSNNVVTNSANTEFTITSKAGNGSFNRGIWENGVWNNGWRDDYTVRQFYEFGELYSTDRNTVWNLRIFGPETSVKNFRAEETVSLSNLAIIDLNGERKLIKNHYRIVSTGTDYIDVEFNYDFPIMRIEKDSNEHRILVSKNIWLKGVFFNGYFKGIWNDGIFNGYPLLAKMDESHWIDGIFNGGHFFANKKRLSFSDVKEYNYKNLPKLLINFTSRHGFSINDTISLTYSTHNEIRTLGTTTVIDVPNEYKVVTDVNWEPSLKDIKDGMVHSIISTGLIQNFDFFSNNASKITSIETLQTESVFSYNSWIDVNYSNQSAVNIGRPESFTDEISDRVFSENNLYGYPTNDIVTSRSVFRDSFSTTFRRYKLGIRYKIFSDYVGDVSGFEDYFEPTNTDDGLENFEQQGWKFDKSNRAYVNISTYKQYYDRTINTTYPPLLLEFINNDAVKDWNVGDTHSISGPFIDMELAGWEDYFQLQNYLETGFLPAQIIRSRYDRYVKSEEFSIVGITDVELPDGKKIRKILTNLIPNIVFASEILHQTYFDTTSNDIAFTVVVQTDNDLIFSRTNESTTTQTDIVGKELKAEVKSFGGILNLTPTEDINGRTNGQGKNTIREYRYSMVEFDVVDVDTKSNYLFLEDEKLGNLPPLHFNNLNFVTREKNFNGTKITSTVKASFLPIHRNINHITTIGRKKQEFFFNKRNLMMNLTGLGQYGVDKVDYYFDNLKLYETDMIPFFLYFREANINRSVQIPNSTETFGISPFIDYTENLQNNEDEVLSYYNKLLTNPTSVKQRVNWLGEFYTDEIIPSLYTQNINTILKENT